MALKAASLKTLGPGRYADNAHGLYFNVKDSGARSWVQRLVIDGRRRTFGLGPYPVVTLREARDIAIDNVRLRRRGINPMAERRRSRTVPTFAADFSLSRGLVGAGVDERDAELGAHERELLGAEVRPVVANMCPVALCGDRQ